MNQKNEKPSTPFTKYQKTKAKLRNKINVEEHKENQRNTYLRRIGKKEIEQRNSAAALSKQSSDVFE